MSVKPWTPQQQGRLNEADWAAIFGTKPVKGSGSFWYAKMDVRDGSILWELKFTTAKTFPVSAGLLNTCAAAILEFGHTDTIPGLAVDMNGEVFTTLRAEDHILALTKFEPYVTPSKAEARRQASRVPSLMR